MREEQPIAVSERDTLTSLPHWVYLVAMCGNCSCERTLNRAGLATRYGPDAIVKSLAPLLRCNRCGNKHHNTIGMKRPPR